MIEQQCFSSLKNQKKQLLNFHEILQLLYNMETQKIINLLHDSSNEESNFATIIQMLHFKIVHYFLHVKQINDVFLDETNHICIAMLMYNLIEYSANYSDTTESLWQFKRDDVPANNADLSINNSESLKYKSALVGETEAAPNNTNSSVKAKIVVPLKYLSNFWRSLDMP